MEAVILAAGRGSRLQAASACKPLTPLLGTTLLDRNIRLALAVGAQRVTIVTGYRHHDLFDWKTQLPSDLRCRVELVHNRLWDETENGYSLVQASKRLAGNFLILMADHVYSLELLQALVRENPRDGAILAVDYRLDRPTIDVQDATKVRCHGQLIEALGKELEGWNAYDTGAFFCSASILPRLKALGAEGDTRLSGFMQKLVVEGRLQACDIGQAYWQDIDTPSDLSAARQGLLSTLADGKRADGPVSRYLNRPCSRWITRHIADTPITPNGISYLVFAITGIAAVLAATANWWPVYVLAGVLIQLASVLDGCDGEIARLRAQSSEYGGWLDSVLDRYGDAVLIAALTWQAMLHTSSIAFWLGIGAMAGSFMASYSAHKSDRHLKERLRVGRDLRMLVIALGIATQQASLALWALAISMNVAVAVRVYRLRHVI